MKRRSFLRGLIGAAVLTATGLYRGEPAEGAADKPTERNRIPDFEDDPALRLRVDAEVQKADRWYGAVPPPPRREDPKQAALAAYRRWETTLTTHGVEVEGGVLLPEIPMPSGFLWYEQFKPVLLSRGATA